MEEEIFECLADLRRDVAVLQEEIVAIKALLSQSEESDPVQQLQALAPPGLLEPTLVGWAEADPSLRAQLVVEIVELCEDERKNADPDGEFYREAPALLQTLIELAGLETIQPLKGEPYRSGQHMVVRNVRGEGQRDQVERCLRRGFRYQGQLLRKAEVCVYL